MTESQHILEKSKVKVRARICDGKATTTNVKFLFFKSGEKFDEKPAELPSTESLGDSGWVEAEVEAPEVDAEKKNYQLTYEVELADRKVTDMPAYTVWPSKGKLTVKKAEGEEAENMVGFRFQVKQNGEIQGEPPLKIVTNDDETYEFELIAGQEFTIEAQPPYEIKEWVKQDGHEVECKAIKKVEADFFAPQKGDRKQYVNVAPADASAADVGRDQKGPVVVVKVGVKGDQDRPEDQKIGKKDMILHFRATYGPKVGNGGIEKSKRADPSNKTEIKKELQVDEVAASESDTVYKGKIKLKEDGTGEMKVYLGLAGGDICKIEIAGSDKFLDDSVPCDASLTFTNWRKSYYEILAADFYRDRELEEVDVSGTKHWDYPAAARTKLKALGDSVYVEYEWVKTHIFAPDKAPTGTVLPKKFLEIGNAGNGYVLTDYTMTRMPTGVTWAKTKVDQTNYIKLCDENYYFERSGGSFPYNLQRMRLTATIEKPKFTVHATHSGYFIPISGNGPGRGGSGAPSLFTPGGANGIDWKADVDPNNYKTEVEAINEDRTATGQPSNKKTITITESNQNPAPCAVEFTKGSVGHCSTSVSGTDKTRIEQWLTAMFAADKLKAHSNKISIKITAEPGASRKQTRFDAVKNIVDTKLTSLKGSNSISVHPGLDDAGQPRKGTLPVTSVDMTTATRKECVVALPKVNDTDPGKFVGVASKTKCPIKLDMYIEVHNRALGLCQNADVLACFSKANAAVDVCVTMHELGHSYNQTVFTASDKPPKGMSKPKTFSQAETENRYKTNGTKGHTYDRHGHSGSHCAYGLSDADKGLASFSGKGASASCVMFGAGGYNRNFCPECVDYIRGANLTKVPAVSE